MKKSENTSRVKNRTSNREFTVVTYSFLILYAALAIYFCYFIGIKSEDFINHAANPRLSVMSKHTVRGDILSSDGKVLATSKIKDSGNEVRVYPEGRKYAHAVGFSVNGMSGAEADANFYLLRSHAFFVERIQNDILEKKNQGDNVYLTLDSQLQDVAYNGLGNYRGAVFAMEPSTGKILAMVSKPDFDPGNVSKDWESLTEDSDTAALLNRCTQGLYPPGSTFKIITALAYLRDHGDEKTDFDCEGSYNSGGYTIHCYGNSVHGKIDFPMAFAKSCNTTFAKVGLSLGKGDLKNSAEDLFFNKSLPSDLSHVKKSSFSMKNNADDALVMQTAIGQGDTLVTPYHMALIASAICKDGQIMTPYYLDRIENNTGTLVRSFHGRSGGEMLISKNEAKKLRKYMRKVVTEGTGSIMNVSKYKAYGKTGTAEYTSDKNKTHSWFVGFAKKGKKEIAIAVVMEGAGAGSSFALPLAKNVFDKYYE